MKKHIAKIAGISLALILLDQISKFLILKYLATPLPLISNFISLQYTENLGIAFSINIPYTLLIITTFILLAIIAIYATKELNLDKKLSRYSLALIIGGGISNLIDRIYHGFVIDFISIGPWPIFNLADIFITLGVLLILIFYKKIKTKKA